MTHTVSNREACPTALECIGEESHSQLRGFFRAIELPKGPERISYISRT
jgi:hypothetical protein